MPFIESEGVNIYYEEKGDGEPVFFLNGVFMSSASWGIISSFISRYFKVVLHDMRGQWKSDKPLQKEKFSFDNHVKDVLNLMDHLNVEKAHLIGTSYGGEIALYFSIKHPERVKSLSIICSVSEVGIETKTAVLRWIEGARSKDPKTFVYSWINDVYSDEFLRVMGMSFVEQLVRVYSSQEFSFDSSLYLLYTFYELEKNPLTPHLDRIRVPTLVIGAEKDRIKPPRYSEIIANNIKNSELVIISNAGHALVVEKPYVLSYLLAGFLLRQKS